jgi:hypothetical protein
MKKQLPWAPRRIDRGHPYWQIAAQRRRVQNASAAYLVDASFYADVPLPLIGTGANSVTGPTGPRRQQNPAPSTVTGPTGSIRALSSEKTVAGPSGGIVQGVHADIRRRPEFDRFPTPIERPAAPGFCELLMCLLVEPEFQEDRLADYEERFNNIWVPKFGWRGGVVIYVWHVLRQSRLLDWLIRVFRWGAPL